MNRLVRIGAFLLGATLLTILIIHSGPAALWHTISGSVWVVAPLVALWGLVYACNARAWQLLMPQRPPEFTFWRAYLLTVSSFAMNYAIPSFSLGGEPLKVAGASPWLGRDRAVGSVVGFRLLHGIAHVLVFLSAVIPAAILLPHTVPMISMLAVATLIFAGIAYFLLSQHRDGIFERGVILLGRFRPLRPLARRLEGNRGRLEELDREMTAIHESPGGFTWALATEVLGRLLTSCEYAILLAALGIGFEPWRAFVITNMAGVVANILFFIPFEMGSKEGGAYVVFGLLGLAPRLGTSAALLIRVRELTWVAIGTCTLLLAGGRKGALEKPRAR